MDLAWGRPILPSASAFADESGSLVSAAELGVHVKMRCPGAYRSGGQLDINDFELSYKKPVSKTKLGEANAGERTRAHFCGAMHLW